MAIDFYSRSLTLLQFAGLYSTVWENGHMLLTKTAGERNIMENVRQSYSSVPSGQWYSVQSQRWDKGIHVPSPHVNSSLLHLSSGASVAGSVASSVHSTTNTSRLTYNTCYVACVCRLKSVSHLNQITMDKSFTHKCRCLRHQAV